MPDPVEIDFVFGGTRETELLYVDTFTPDGKQVTVGHWHVRPEGLWALRVRVYADQVSDVGEQI